MPCPSRRGWSSPAPCGLFGAFATPVAAIAQIGGGDDDLCRHPAFGPEVGPSIRFSVAAFTRGLGLGQEIIGQAAARAQHAAGRPAGRAVIRMFDILVPSSRCCRQVLA